MEKTRKILDTALKLFVEYGFHGTPTSKIAQEAGVANGTLFNKFATKDDLILVLYVDIKTRMNEYIAENSTQENSLKEIMKGQYLASLYWALDNKNEFRFVEQFKARPPLQSGSSLKLPTGQFLNGRPGSRLDGTTRNRFL
ncbi:MAG: TetR/AcrR family transcriptional regulator [Bacteroidales bacterium]